MLRFPKNLSNAAIAALRWWRTPAVHISRGCATLTSMRYDPVQIRDTLLTMQHDNKIFLDGTSHPFTSSNFQLCLISFPDLVVF